MIQLETCQIQAGWSQSAVSVMQLPLSESQSQDKTMRQHFMILSEQPAAFSQCSISTRRENKDVVSVAQEIRISLQSGTR